MSIPGYTVIDLSHPLREGMVSWPAQPPVRQKAVMYGMADDAGDIAVATAKVVEMSTRSGTHVVTGRGTRPHAADVAQLPSGNLVAPVVVLHRVDHAAANPDLCISSEMVKSWEAAHGRIPARSVVLLNTDWARYWGDETFYFHGGDRTTERLRYPGFSLECIEFLVNERRVMGLGSDAPGIDAGCVRDETALDLALGDAVFTIVNLRNLARLPEHGAFLFTGVLPLKGEEAAPARVLGLAPDQREAAE